MRVYKAAVDLLVPGLSDVIPNLCTDGFPSRVTLIDTEHPCWFLLLARAMAFNLCLKVVVLRRLNSI